jgi:hypothetical protein
VNWSLAQREILPTLRFILALLTFPGLVVRLVSLRVVVWLFRLPHFYSCWLRPIPVAAISEGKPLSKPWLCIIIVIGPFLANTILGALAGAPALLPYCVGGIGLHFPELGLAWLGVSIATHAFPDPRTAECAWEVARRPRARQWHRALLRLSVALPCAGAIASRYCLDVVYGIAVVWLPAKAVVSAISGGALP